MAEYIGQLRKHDNKLFIVKLDMVVVFSKKDFNLTLKFKQLREAFASRQPTDFGIKQKSQMLRSQLFGQKSEESVVFCHRTNEVDHFDRNVHMLKCIGVVNSARTSYATIRSLLAWQTLISRQSSLEHRQCRCA